jgi:hypothetical protein
LKHTFVKTLLALTLMLLATQTLSAQRRKVMHLPKFDHEPYHFGFILAANQMMLTWKPVDDYQDIYWNASDVPDLTIPFADKYRVSEISTRPVPGFAVGIVGVLRLGNYFDLKLVPTLAFGERYIDYGISSYDNAGNFLESVSIRKSLPSTMVDFPLYVKYRSKRYNNFASYIIAGGKYSIEMASTKKINSANGQYPVKTDRNDFAAEVGVGFDFYTPYFKFGVETKMSYGIKNILIKDGFLYSEMLDHLNNKVFQLTFTFE